MTHPMERLLTTSADSQRRVDSKQAVMAYLVSVSCEPAGGLYPSASYRFFSAQESRPHEKQPQASWYRPRKARTMRRSTAKLFQCAIAVGTSLFPMSRGRFAFTKVQKLQMLSSEVAPRVFVQSKTLWPFFCQTLCPFYLRRGVGSYLSKTTVFRPDACASEETCVSVDSKSVLFSDAFFSSSSRIALRLLKSQRENRRVCFSTRVISVFAGSTRL